MSENDNPEPPGATTDALAAAVAHLRHAAAGGHAEARFRLGMMYAQGEGVETDYVEAAAWLERAAEQDHARAQRVLAWLYANGFGVDQDDRRAGEWYLRAARGGDAAAQFTAASMYRWGRFGVARDPARMLEWYRRAADAGLASAQCALGQLLADGEAVPADDGAAFQWLSLAILNGSEAAKRALAELSERMAPEAIERAKRDLLRREAADDA